MINLSKIKTFLKTYKLPIGMGIIILFFVIARWGIWNYFMVPLIYSDSFLYYEVAQKMYNGNIPSFDYIGGGYPLIIYLSRLISDGGWMIILFQQLITLFTTLYLFYVFCKERSLALAGFLFAVLYVLLDKVVKWEISIFPDSIIANLLLLVVPLAIELYRGKRLLPALIIGFVCFYSIFIRSSSVFLIPAIGLLGLFFFLIKERKVALYLVGSFTVFCLGLASYNALYSAGNQFSILTYARMKEEKKEQVNSTLELSKEELQTAKLILKKLPKDSNLWKYLFSWKPHDITLGMINSRSGSSVQKTNNDIVICKRGNYADSSCLVVAPSSYITHNLTTDETYTLLSNYPFRKNTLTRKIRFFYAYSNNLTLNHYGKTYYGVKDAAQKTSIERSNELINLWDSNGQGTLAFALGNLYKSGLDKTHEERQELLHNNYFFKLYDLFHLKIEEPIFRHLFWIILSFIGVFFSTIRVIKRKNLNTIDFTILLSFIIYMGAALIFSVITNPLPRYSFETEFFFYLTGIIVITQTLQTFRHKLYAPK